MGDRAPWIGQVAVWRVRTAESDVDERVGAADAALHPDSDGREENGDDAEENVAAAHG